MKTKALISFAVTAKLICVFVFAYAKSRFSHDAAHIILFKIKVLGFENLNDFGVKLHMASIGDVISAVCKLLSDVNISKSVKSN